MKTGRSCIENWCIGNLKIDETEDKSMFEVLSAQKTEADGSFSDFVIKNYEDWISNPDVGRPLLSHNLLKQRVFPELGDEPVFLIVIDNLRYDQWKMIEPEVAELFLYRYRRTLFLHFTNYYLLC